MLKSVGVVVGSYLLSVVLVIATDPILKWVFPGQFEKGAVPSTAPLIASTAFFIVISIFCAWLCARLAPGRADRHVLWFFLMGEVMGLVATVPNWSTGWPHWYWLSWLLSWPLSCWLGLTVASRREKRASATIS